MTQAVTLKDIAKEANLSIGAVSKALSGHSDASSRTRDRVLAISDKLNYQPRRRGPAANKPGRVAFVLCGMDGIASQNDGYRHSRTELMTRFAAEKGLRLELATMESLTDEVTGASRAASSDSFDAIVLCGAVIDYPLIQRVEALGIPWLSFGTPSGEHNDAVTSGHLIIEAMIEMGRAATELLIQQSHRRIGFFSGQRVDGGWNAGWLAGYHLAHLAHGLPIDPALSPMFDQGPHGEIGIRAADHFAQSDPTVTAWVTPTALGASRFIQGMTKHGIQVRPTQLVSGCDGGEVPRLDDLGLHDFPVISTDLQAECRLACELLRSMADGGCPTPARHYLPFQRRNFNAL